MISAGQQLKAGPTTSCRCGQESGGFVYVRFIGAQQHPSGRWVRLYNIVAGRRAAMDSTVTLRSLKERGYRVRILGRRRLV